MNKELVNLIADNKIEEVINKLQKITKANSNLYNEIIHLAARYEEYNRQRRLNLTDNSTLNIELANIRQGLLYIIKQVSSDSLAIPTYSWNRFTINIIILFTIVILFAGITNLFIRNDETKSVFKQNTKIDSLKKLEKQTNEVNIVIPHLQNNEIDLFSVTNLIEKQIKEKNLPLSQRFILWDTCLFQVRKQKIEDNNVVETKDLGRDVLQRRQISDSYLATCRLLNIKTNYIKTSNGYCTEENKLKSQEFINELGKKSLNLDYFILSDKKNNCQNKGKENEKTNENNALIVNFRLRLGALIYQNLTSLCDPSIFYLKGEYSNVLLPEERSPELVEQLWLYFKDVVYKVIPKQEFHNKGYMEIINRLLISHDFIYSQDYKTIFTKILQEKSKGQLFNDCDGIPRNSKIDMNNFWGMHFSD